MMRRDELMMLWRKQDVGGSKMLMMRGQSSKRCQLIPELVGSLFECLVTHLACGCERSVFKTHVRCFLVLSSIPADAVEVF